VNAGEEGSLLDSLNTQNGDRRSKLSLHQFFCVSGIRSLDLGGAHLAVQADLGFIGVVDGDDSRVHCESGWDRRRNQQQKTNTEKLAESHFNFLLVYAGRDDNRLPEDS